jgi:D-glutamate cyclase
MLAILDPDLDQSVVEAMVRDGPAVDGVTLERQPTIDALGMPVHHEIMKAITAIVGP